jgi:hypothetical protein
MWVQQNINYVFYYQEIGIEMGMVVSPGKTYLSFWVSKHHGKGK